MLFALVLGLLLVCYVVYYRRYVASRPELVCCDAERKKLLEERCPILSQTYFPTIWAPLAHLQSVARPLLQTYPKHTRRRENLTMRDGGHICLDWYNECAPSQPTLLVLPGITGSSDENYIRHWIDDMHQQEYRCVVFNYRGCGHSKLSTTKLYCGANIEDLEEVLEHIHQMIPDSPLLAIGVSLGSTQLVKYLSECKRLGRECRLKAVLLFSVLWDMMETQKSLARFVTRHTLVRYLTFKFTKMMKENRGIFEDAIKKGELCFDYHKAIKATSLEGLAREMIVPMFGYSSLEEYLQDWSPCNRLDGITIPVLAVNAHNDPFCPPDSLPVSEAERNPLFNLAIMKSGGHVSFIEGLLPRGKCWMDRLLIQFANAIFEHDDL